MSIFRSPDNPIIEPKDIKPSRENFEVIGVFNAGVTRFKDQVILLLRVAERPISEHPDTILTAVYDVAEADFVTKEFSKETGEIDFSDRRLIITPNETYLTSISHLKLARSKDGIKFEIEDTAAIAPANDYETFGIEDPRISLIDGTYYISYVAVSPLGVVTCLASTKDFTSFERHGIIFAPENKDVVLFPGGTGFWFGKLTTPSGVEGQPVKLGQDGRATDSKFYALHRPDSPLFRKQEIWIAESPDLRCWGNHRRLMGPRPGYWDEMKIGASAVPFRIDPPSCFRKKAGGWLEIYHGADRKNRYCLGAVLLDGQEPWKVIARAEKPILEPQTDYECDGFLGNVVFSCGLLYEDDKLKIYYGAADTIICYAELPLADVIENLNL